MRRWGNGQDSIIEPIPYSSNGLELTEAKLQGLGLWPSTPAQLGVEHDWPVPGAVAKNVFAFFSNWTTRLLSRMVDVGSFLPQLPGTNISVILGKWD